MGHIESAVCDVKVLLLGDQAGPSLLLLAALYKIALHRMYQTIQNYLKEINVLFTFASRTTLHWFTVIPLNLLILNITNRLYG